MTAAYTILKENLPETCEIIEPTGGYFIWIKYPENIDINKFHSYSKEKYSVSAISGNDFATSNGTSFSNYQRISIAFHGQNELKPAILNLCKAYSEFVLIKD